MTNNEAIGILEIAVETAKGRCFVTDEAISDAYIMAISALKAQEAKIQLSREDTTLGVKKTCITCKHYPQESKWPCIDCDMRVADRWEAQEAKHSTELSLIQETFDTVSRQEVIDEIRKCRFVVDAIEKIRGLPPAQLEREKGEWIPLFDGRFTGGAYWFHCSKCERVVPDVRNGGWNFCPNCGKDMRGDSNE